MTAVRTTPLAPREEPRCFAEEAAAQMERFVEDFGHMYRERNEALREVTRAHHEALLHLSMAAEFRDDDTSVHIIRIGYLAEALALHLGSTQCSRACFAVQPPCTTSERLAHRITS